MNLDYNTTLYPSRSYEFNLGYHEERVLALERMDVAQTFINFQNNILGQNWRIASRILETLLTYCNNSDIASNDNINPQILSFILTNVLNKKLVVKDNPLVSNMIHNTYKLLIELSQNRKMVDYLIEMHLFKLLSPKLSWTNDNFSISCTSALFCKIISLHRQYAISAINDGIIDSCLSAVNKFASSGYISIFSKYIVSNIYILEYLLRYPEILDSSSVQAISSYCSHIIAQVKSNQFTQIKGTHEKQAEILKSIIHLVVTLIKYDSSYINEVYNQGLLYSLVDLFKFIIYQSIWSDILDLLSMILGLVQDDQEMGQKIIELVNFNDLLEEFLRNPTKPYSATILRVLEKMANVDDMILLYFPFEPYFGCITEKFNTFMPYAKKTVVSFTGMVMFRNLQFFDQLLSTELLFEFVAPLGALDMKDQEKFVLNLDRALSNYLTQQLLDEHIIQRFGEEYGDYIDDLETNCSEETISHIKNIRKLLGAE